MTSSLLFLQISLHPAQHEAPKAISGSLASTAFGAKISGSRDKQRQLSDGCKVSESVRERTNDLTNTVYQRCGHGCEYLYTKLPFTPLKSQKKHQESCFQSNNNNYQQKMIQNSFVQG